MLENTEKLEAIFVEQVHQTGHGSGSKFQFPLVYGFKNVSSSVVIIEIALRIRLVADEQRTLFF